MTSLPVRYVANILCRRRGRTTFTATCLLIVVLLAVSSLTSWNELSAEEDRDRVDWEMEFERARRESLREHMSFYVAGGTPLRPVPPDWTARDRCPACFGTDMCDAVDSQVLESGLQ